MANKNKFQVFGQVPDSDEILPTGGEAYNEKFGKGLEANTLAKSQDVLTPLRELTIFSVAFLDWLGDKTLVDVGDFKDPDIDQNPETTRTNLKNAIANLQKALVQAIDNRIDSKEPIINKQTGFLKSDGTNWFWDANTYQLAYAILTSINNYYANNNNEGLMYKSKNDNTLKSTDKEFIYFDSDETTAEGNHILNLKSFKYSSNN